MRFVVAPLAVYHSDRAPKKAALAILAVTLAMFMTGCMQHTFTVSTGAPAGYCHRDAKPRDALET